MVSGNTNLTKAKIRNCIENNKEYMKSIENQRKAILASIADYQALEDTIYLKPYLFEIRGIGGYADPTSKIALSRERKMEEERLKKRNPYAAECIERESEIKGTGAEYNRHDE